MRDLKLSSHILALFVLIGASLPAWAETYWIDVRSEGEYAEGHLVEAVNIPYREIKRRIFEVTDDKQAEIKLYCGSGRRAGIAKAALEQLGYENVSNEGGYQDILEKRLGNLE